MNLLVLAASEMKAEAVGVFLIVCLLIVSLLALPIFCWRK